ncbi:MAG: alpha/beta hydrolase, partial [Thermogutta sp.]|nr:alpha/beta hydrolase [Thermogutta sp.]
MVAEMPFPTSISPARLPESRCGSSRKHPSGVFPRRCGVFLRRSCLTAVAAAAFLLLLAGGFASAAEDSSASQATAATDWRPGGVWTVRDSSHGGSFDCEIVSVAEKETCRVVRLRYPSPVVTELPQNNVIPVEYYLPLNMRPGDEPRPAVVCLHILDGSLELVRALSSVLASRGIPAMVFQLPYYGERGGPNGPRDILASPERFTAVLGQALEEVRRAVDFLASRPEVRADRIGVAGISLGGVVAASAAEREPRLHRAALILAGGDIPAILAAAREAEELRRFLEGLSEEQRAAVWETLRQCDPLYRADALRDRAQAGNVLMINAAEDEVIPRACTEKLAQALGIADKVIWLEGMGHYTSLGALPRVLEVTADFFAQDLPPAVATAPPSTTGGLTPAALLATTLREWTRFYLQEPSPGQCHIVRLSAEVQAEQTRQGGELMLIRGNGYRFRLAGKVPQLGDFTIGQGDYPWMTSVAGRSFAGREGLATVRSPLSYVRPEYLRGARLAVMAVAGAAASPAALEALVEIRESPAEEGRRTLVVTPLGEPRPAARLVYPAGAQVP